MQNVSALAVKADSMTTSSSNYGSLSTIHILLDWSIKGNSVVYHLTVVDRRDSRLLVGQGVVIVAAFLDHGRRLSDSAGAAIYPVMQISSAMLHLERGTQHTPLLLLVFYFKCAQGSPRVGRGFQTFCSSICSNALAWPCLQNSHDLGPHSFGDPCRKALLLRNSHCPSSVGFGRRLQAGGGLRRRRRHWHSFRCL